MKKFTIVYVIICVLDILSIHLFPSGQMVLKPLIGASLLAYYITSLEKQHSLIITALVFTVMSDVVLLFGSHFFFKAALMLFCVAALLFILYLRQFKENTLNGLQKVLIVITILFGATASIYFAIRYPSFNWVIIIAMTVSSVLAFLSLRFPRLNREVSTIGIGGLLLLLYLILYTSFYLLELSSINYTFATIFYMIGFYLFIVGITDDAVEFFNRKAEVIKRIKRKKKKKRK